jgi:hypothetical protein
MHAKVTICAAPFVFQHQTVLHIFQYAGSSEPYVIRNQEGQKHTFACFIHFSTLLMLFSVQFLVNFELLRCMIHYLSMILQKNHIFSSRVY